MVTVYITNYNYAKYIRQSIDSVLAQTMQDFELLIIDDGSTDNSKQIIDEYAKNPRVTAIYQQNKGLNVTNNIAMRAAKGTYIMRLDADDYLAPDALETMALVLDQDPELGLVFPDYYYVNESGELTGEERRHNFEKEVSLYDQPAHGACTMIRLQFLKEIGGYNESFTCQDGYDLWIKFIMHFKVTNVARSLFYYRRHKENLTTNEDKILSTRKKIKDQFVEAHRLTTPSTVAVIPVRNTWIGKTNWPLCAWNDKTVLESAIETALASTRIQYVVVTTAEESIVGHLAECGISDPRLIIIRRPPEFAKASQSLQNTLAYVLDRLQERKAAPEAIMSVSLEYPFLTSEVIDDAVNTLTIFNCDSLLSVRPDNLTYYQHVGHGMVPILNHDKFTKLEREAVYKGAGGIVLATVKSFRQAQRMIAGKVGHIVVNQKTAMGVFSELDLFVCTRVNEESVAPGAKNESTAPDIIHHTTGRSRLPRA